MKKLRKMMVWNLVTVVVLYFFIRNGVAETKPYLINCGVNSSTNANGRKWVGDSAPDNGFTLSSSGISVSTAQVNGNSMYENLYKTARIFTEPMNYSFRIDPGSYYLRFHFYPFLVEDHNVNDSLFEMMANSLKLVSGFNITGEIFRKKTYLESRGRNYTSPALLKEYILSINSPQLVIKLIPAVGSFAFLNAMEIIPVNKKIFTDSANKVGGGNGAGGSLNLNERGIETMYRLNVGGQEIEPNEDPDLWRVWESDNGYMFTSYAGSETKNSSTIAYASSNDSLIAPLRVYETARVMTDNEVLEKRFNMSWKFNVDPNFDYLVRLHFCELTFDKPNMRVFRIYINNRTAAEQFDVFARAGGKNIAYHQDYLDTVSSQTNTIWVQLGPDTSAGAGWTDALLNGLEIFKLSRNGNLAQPSEKIGLSGNPGSRKVLESKALWVGIGAGVASIAALAVLSALLYRQYHQRQKMPPTKTHNPGWRPLFLHGTFGNSTTNMRGSKFPSGSMNVIGSMATTRIGRRFTLVELKIATNNFDEALVIGVGGFGKVYKGEIEEGVLAAIKRAHPQSEQGLAEFETEIEMLSMLRHRHLVSMIGFCEEQNEMILVYEYMANGTLRSHLFGNDLPPLTWKQRIDICIGAARGLYYLHTGSDRGIIHRDVKTTNILLDENFVAKMADFGLSRTGPAMDHTHVSTAVKGSFGYLDPEYFRRQQLTEKSDVYSFGVVLFEVVCGRPVIDPSLPKDQINLAEWAMRWQRQGSLGTIVDPKLMGNYSKESLAKFGEIAEKCLADEGKNRPTMGEVLWHLDCIMQLHEASLRNNNGGDGGFSSGSEIPASLDTREERNSQTSFDIIKSQEEEEEEEAPVRRTVILDGAMGVDEFSQLVHPQGR